MYKRITLKVGSSVLTDAEGGPSAGRIAQLVDQIAALKARGVEVLFVSSGAIASGRTVIRQPRHNDTVSCRQLWASVGQIRLIQLYADLFARKGIVCSQVLATKEDFRDRRHFLNMRNCLETLLENNIVPIINENDVISVTELMFTDNDELSGLISDMMNVDALVILSNVAGLYNGDPANPASTVIRTVPPYGASVAQFVSSQKSDFGRGGMVTKSAIARKVAQNGIPVHLACGFEPGILTDIVDGKDVVHTYFAPGRRKTPIKRWLAHADGEAKGTLRINEQAVSSLFSEKASSLLPVGVIAVEGTFQKGDVVRIVDREGRLVGLGKTEYDHVTAARHIGAHHARPVVRYDYLYLYSEPS